MICKNQILIEHTQKTSYIWEESIVLSFRHQNNNTSQRSIYSQIYSSSSLSNSLLDRPNRFQTPNLFIRNKNCISQIIFFTLFIDDRLLWHARVISRPTCILNPGPTFVLMDREKYNGHKTGLFALNNNNTLQIMCLAIIVSKGWVREN